VRSTSTSTSTLCCLTATVPDRVFELSGGLARFRPLPAPTEEEVTRLLTKVIRKVAKYLDGLGTESQAEAARGDALAALQAAEVERRSGGNEPFQKARRSAHLDGFSLHAGVRIHPRDRAGLERLCRYLLRPPFALHRLSAGPGGQLLYRMKRSRGGSQVLALTPDPLLAKLATLAVLTS